MERLGGLCGGETIKAGLRSNSIAPNARHCMASAVIGLMRTFGRDEPLGSYKDIEAADTFVLLGSNMTEKHPIVRTRITECKLSYPHVIATVLAIYEHHSFGLTELPMIYTPQTDLTIFNHIVNCIVKTKEFNKDFVRHARVRNTFDVSVAR